MTLTSVLYVDICRYAVSHDRVSSNHNGPIAQYPPVARCRDIYAPVTTVGGTTALSHNFNHNIKATLPIHVAIVSI
jgi:hypothetical protein